jgi:group I intron endonuclease
MYYTIYKITNKINGKVYIGSHKTRNLDDNYMGSGKYLLRAIEKHGIEHFTKEILHVFDNPEDMYAKEAELVNEDFLTEANTYNLKKGGFGGFDYINSHPELYLTEKRLASLSPIEVAREGWKKKWQNDSSFREQHIENALTALANYKETYGSPFKNRKHKEETKQLIGLKNSIHQSGEGNSQYGTIWIHNTSTKENAKIGKNDIIPEGWNKGRIINKRRTESFCKTCGKVVQHSGKYCSKTCWPKQDNSIRKRINARSKRCSVLGIEYPAVSIAADTLGIGHETMRMRIKSSNYPDYFYI